MLRRPNERSDVAVHQVLKILLLAGARLRFGIACFDPRRQVGGHRPPGAVDLVECDGDVEFDNVDFAYLNGIPVLKQFSLHLRPGETVALVGRTGSGKSTVSRLIPRFYDVQAGRVTIDGADVRTLTLNSLRREIGAIAQDPFLFSASVRENLAFGRPGATDEEIEHAARLARGGLDAERAIQLDDRVALGIRRRQLDAERRQLGGRHRREHGQHEQSRHTLLLSRDGHRIREFSVPGSGGQDRTGDKRLMSPLLYH